MMPARSFYAMPVVASLGPVAVVNSEQFTNVIDMSLYQSVDAVVMLGDMANEEITLRVVACDSDGGNPTASIKDLVIGGATIANDNTQHALGLSDGELLTAQSTKRYVKFGAVTASTSGGIIGIMVRATPARYSASESATDSFGTYA